MKRLPAFPFRKTRRLSPARLRAMRTPFALLFRVALPISIGSRDAAHACHHQPVPRHPRQSASGAGDGGFMTARDGLRLRYARFAATGRPLKGTVVILPGRNECIEKYFETIRDLSARGLGSAIVDWRGQGDSGRTAARPGARLYRQFLRLCPRPRAVLRGDRAARLPRPVLHARPLDRLAGGAAGRARHDQPRAPHGAGRAAAVAGRLSVFDADHPPRSPTRSMRSASAACTWPAARGRARPSRSRPTC